MRRISLTRSAILAAAFGTILVMAAVPRAATDAPDQVIRIAGLDVAVWLPTGGPGPHPLVLFSHGVGGCKTQSSNLMRALARDGILVAAPDHDDKDTRCPGRLPGREDLPQGFLDPATWGPSFYEGRRKDLQDLRAALQTDPALSPLIDPGHVALVGHSLGGYTVLGLAGAWPSWKTGGIAAVVALAPFVQPRRHAGRHRGSGAVPGRNGGQVDHAGAGRKWPLRRDSGASLQDHLPRRRPLRLDRPSGRVPKAHDGRHRGIPEGRVRWRQPNDDHPDPAPDGAGRLQVREITSQVGVPPLAPRCKIPCHGIVLKPALDASAIVGDRTCAGASRGTGVASTTT